MIAIIIAIWWGTTIYGLLSKPLEPDYGIYDE